MYCVSPEVAELVPQIVCGGQLITLVVWDVLKSLFLDPLRVPMPSFFQLDSCFIFGRFVISVHICSFLCFFLPLTVLCTGFTVLNGVKSSF